jgi:hypothetical protein
MWTRCWTSGFHKMLGSSRVAAQLAASQEGLSSMSEWVSEFCAWSAPGIYKEKFQGIYKEKFQGIYKEKFQGSSELSRKGSSSEDGSLRWMSRNGKKGITLWPEDFMCDLKLQWDCNKSVARVRLVKTENPSACVTVNCKVCRSAIALYCL